MDNANLAELVAKLNDPDLDVRVQTLKSIAELEPFNEDCVRALIRSLRHDPVPEVRRYAATCLLLVGGEEPEKDPRRTTPEFVPALIAAMQSDSDVWTRSTVASALGDIGNQSPTLIDALYAAFQRDVRGVRWMAARSLGRIGHAACKVVPEIIPMLHSSYGIEQHYALSALREFGPDAAPAVPDLIELLKACDPESGEQHWLILTLGDIGPAAVVAISDLEHIAADETLDGLFRDAARDALALIRQSANQ